MCAPSSGDELDDEFEVQIARQSARIERGKKEKGDSFWMYVGLIGVVGWSVVLPMLIGVLLGQWIDRRYGTGYVWTLSLMAFGLCMGCYNAWRSVTKEA